MNDNELKKLIISAYTKIKEDPDIKTNKIYLKKDFEWGTLICDWTFFRNNYSSAYIFMRSLILSLILLAIITIICYIIALIINNIYFFCYNKHSIKITQTKNFELREFIVIYSAFIGGIYWELMKIFSSKWLYCAQIYNKIHFDIEKHKIDDQLHILEMKTLLSIDILHMSLWNNNSFFNSFKLMLELAINLYSKDREVDFNKINNEQMSEKEAGELLEKLDANLDKITGYL